MKKLFSVFFAIVAIVALAACGSGDAKAVADKIDNREELTPEDYTVMTDYCVSALNEIKPLIEKAVQAQKDGDTAKAEELQEEAKELEEKYPYSQKFMQAIMTASQDELGESNSKKIQEVFESLMQLQLGM